MLQRIPPGQPPGDLSRAYHVAIGMHEGRCTYRIGNMILDARGLTDVLKDGYESERGIELLTGPDLRYRCLKDARAAVKRAGFRRIRARPITIGER